MIPFHTAGPNCSKMVHDPLTSSLGGMSGGKWGLFVALQGVLREGAHALPPQTHFSARLKGAALDEL